MTEQTDLTTLGTDAEALARALVDLRDLTIQKARIQFGNRLSAIERGADQRNHQDVIERWHATFEQLERELDADIRTLSDDLPIVAYMTAVRGVGPLLAVKVAAMIDIHRAETVSALWRYAGYAVMDGERERPVKGEKRHYNARLKTACYLIGTSFLKTGSPYRQVYDDARAYYEANRPDWTKGHQHNAAMRKMIKMWLSHLWQVWRALEGEPIPPPYAHQMLGHNHYYSPQDFGWPDVP